MIGGHLLGVEAHVGQKALAVCLRSGRIHLVSTAVDGDYGTRIAMTHDTLVICLLESIVSTVITKSGPCQ